MDGAKAPWNKDHAQGQHRALSPAQVRRIKEILAEKGRLRDLALFSLALDTLLRASDLLALRVSDVQDAAGNVRSELAIRQRKTAETLQIALSDSTREVVARLIGDRGKVPADFLFTSKGPRKPKLPAPLNRRSYGQLVKKWCVLSHVDDPAMFSTHSLRRTRAAFIYENTCNLEAVRRVLGHKSLGATSAYLGIDNQMALDVARKFQL
jgi:integrase